MYDLPALIADEEQFQSLCKAIDGSAPVTSIREAKIKLTARCNLRCRFCRFWQMHAHDELATAEVLNLIDDLAALNCQKIHFSGGESTLRDDLETIITHAAQRGIRTSLTSNGTLITEQRASSLVQTGLRSLTMSLDSTSPAQHDHLRGVKGAFKRTVAALKWIRQARKAHHAKIKVRINMVLTRHNYHEYPDLLAFVGELGVHDVTCIPVDEKHNSENRLLPWQLAEYNETIAPAVAAIRARYGFSQSPHLIYPFGTNKDDLQHAANAEYARGYFTEHVCFVPWLNTLITWDGNVWLCCMSRGRISPLGNVRQTPFRRIFLGEPYEEVRRQFRTARYPVCHRCDDFMAENMVLQSALNARSDTNTVVAG
ncbi:MAG TPA: radical SAM protein [Armatimonadota bacterium]|nr:radical SAM protein [Armatimonadota bacterium]